MAFGVEQKNLIMMNTVLLILNALGFVYTIYIIIVTSLKTSDKVSKILRSLTIIHVLCYLIRFGTFFSILMISNKEIKGYINIVSSAFWVYYLCVYTYIYIFIYTCI